MMNSDRELSVCTNQVRQLYGSVLTADGGSLAFAPFAGSLPVQFSWKFQLKP
jgi:hypothetical protein